MAPELLEIQPRELKFTFELKKQSSCSVHLINNSNNYVAFKVKTTSPKRYCVRPNTGVILPRSTCDFTVTMQAQRVAPPDMQLKDKFLVQSTVVSLGTTDEDIVPSFFSKENGRHIEESKLRVVLVSPPHSPVLHPINGALKQEPVYEALDVKQEPVYEALDVKQTPILDDQTSSEVEILHPLDVAKDVEELKLKFNDLEMKLNEAHMTITKMKEEKSVVIQERDNLQQEIMLLRRKCASKVQVGFPFLFVVFMALVGAALGFWLHP